MIEAYQLRFGRMAFAILHGPIAFSNVARQHIHAPDLRKYRTELPNLVDDMGLGPYEFRLLVHYYRVGNCWESTRTTARKCAMSVGKVSEARRSLERRKLIEIGDNVQGTLQINVVDIWPQNFQNYAERAKKKSIRRRLFRRQGPKGRRLRRPAKRNALGAGKKISAGKWSSVLSSIHGCGPLRARAKRASYGSTHCARSANWLIGMKGALHC